MAAICFFEKQNSGCMILCSVAALRVYIKETLRTAWIFSYSEDGNRSALWNVGVFSTISRGRQPEKFLLNDQICCFECLRFYVVKITHVSRKIPIFISRFCLEFYLWCHIFLQFLCCFFYTALLTRDTLIKFLVTFILTRHTYFAKVLQMKALSSRQRICYCDQEPSLYGS
jgi:hypothetical protein